MTLDCGVVSAKFVIGQRVSATLENNTVRTVVLTHCFHDFLENIHKLLVTHALFEGYI